MERGIGEFDLRLDSGDVKNLSVVGVSSQVSEQLRLADAGSTVEEQCRTLTLANALKEIIEPGPLELPIKHLLRLVPAVTDGRALFSI
jgi:hypothetical protein